MSIGGVDLNRQRSTYCSLKPQVLNRQKESTIYMYSRVALHLLCF